jgi:uncharacterized protein (DUF486 family)
MHGGMQNKTKGYRCPRHRKDLKLTTLQHHAGYISLQTISLVMLRTIILLTASNVFMTFAWYYHLKHTGWPLWKAILLSWLIAFFEYCLMVPANRYGFLNGVNTFQLKIVQEVITLIVFSLFAVLVLKEPFHSKYLISFFFLLGAVYFMFKK